ncbi:nuclear intron maturase 2, mitochondrial-like [Neltuma alba]|uniref:nuclear intron maturase 2, mitochondrial-like n=1 Tax=Neltuma alba TaxID=207710 RepID=UPI0010A2C9DD|nr:nuclear intron maturase 2, mitochondrial-like [Prosopis alba]
MGKICPPLWGNHGNGWDRVFGVPSHPSLTLLPLPVWNYRSPSFTPVRPHAPDPNDPSTLMKEAGVSVCCQTWIENYREPDRVVTNLTSYFRRFELWVLAYQKFCADETGASLPRSAVQRFKWGVRLGFFIKSPKDKTDYPSLSKIKIKAILTTTQPAPFQNKIVQEVLLMILEPIYEARFSQKSFAYRAGRNSQSLEEVDDGEKKKKKKRKFQKKRVLAEDEPKPDPYWLETFFGFAPEKAEKIPNWGHCGILSPLLANICFDGLDRWMEGKIKEFYRPSKSNVIWNSLESEAEQGNTSWPEFVPTSTVKHIHQRVSFLCLFGITKEVLSCKIRFP